MSYGGDKIYEVGEWSKSGEPFSSEDGELEREPEKLPREDRARSIWKGDRTEDPFRLDERQLEWMNLSGDAMDAKGRTRCASDYNSY